MEHPLAEMLDAWLDGELPAGRHAEVAAHLAACAGCARRVRLWRAAARALLPPREVAPSEAFVSRVMARLPEDEPAGVVWPAGWLTPALAAGAAALVLLWPHARAPLPSAEALLLEGEPDRSPGRMTLGAEDPGAGELLAAALEER